MKFFLLLAAVTCMRPVCAHTTPNPDDKQYTLVYVPCDRGTCEEMVHDNKGGFGGSETHDGEAK